MATRLNKRFILILTGVILVLGFGVAVVAYFAITGDANRQIRLGEELEAQGDYRGAIDRYGRAIGKEPMNLDHYDRFEGALLKIIPETRVEAQNKYQQYLALLEKRKGASVDNPDSWLRMINANRRRAVILTGSGTDVWGPIQEQSERMASQFDEDGDEEAWEANQAARAITLHAMSMRRDLLKPSEETRFEEEEAYFLEQGSDNPLVWEALLNDRLMAAARYRSKGDTRLLTRTLTGEGGFDELAEKMQENGVEMTPEILALQMRRCQLTPSEETDARYEELYVDFTDFTADIVARIQAGGATQQAAHDGDLLRRAILMNALRSSDVIATVRPLLDAELLEMDLCLLLFQNLVQIDPKLAQRAAERVLEIEPMPVGLLSMMQAGARGEASLALFDSLYFQRAQDTDAVSIADLMVAREEALAEHAGEPTLKDVELYLGGSIDLVSGDALSARSKFSEIASSPLVRSMAMQRRFIPRFVTSSVLAGERGVAIEQLRTYADNLPPDVVVGIRVSIAGELFSIGRLEGALEQVNKALAAEPENEDANTLKGLITDRVAVLEGAPAGASTPESILYARARGALAEGRLEDARELLLGGLDQFDTTLFKKMLISVDTMLGNKEEARAIAATIEDADRDGALEQQLIMLEVDDPIERIYAVSDASFDDEPSRNALKFVYLLDLAYSANPGFEDARAELPAAFEQAIAELSSDRSLSQRVIMSALEMDRFNNAGDGEDSAAGRALAALDLVETDEVHALNTKARVEATRGRPAMALEILAPLSERGVDTAHTWYTRGMAYGDLGRLEEATDAFEKAVNRAPDNWRFVIGYAQILESSGEYDKALALLRESRRSQAMALQIRGAWLDAEAFYGDRRTALDQRLKLYVADIEDGQTSRRVIDMSNALELARLLLIIQPEREDIKKPNGENRYSVTAWANLSGSERRNELADSRARRKAYAFEIIDEVEKSGREDVARASVKLVRAQAHELFEDTESLEKELRELQACCNDLLLPPQRLRLASLLESIGDEEGVNEQFRRLAESENLAELRTLVVELGRRDRLNQANEVAARIAVESGLPTDSLVEAQTLVGLGELDRAREMIDKLSLSSDFVRNKDLKYQLLILESNLLGMLGQQEIEKTMSFGRQELDLAGAGDQAGAQRAASESANARAQAEAYFLRGVSVVEEAMELAPGRIVPVLRMHEMLRARVLMLEDAAGEADMLENARLARDISPVDWRANKCLMEAYLVIGNPREAMAVVDQYFRRGGLSAEARDGLLAIARLEGTPGLAIPPLERAMELDPINPAWPRAIAAMLMENDDPQGASDMWWRVLELEATPAAIDQFVELEFRRSKPNMKRLREAFAMKPDIAEGKPELKAALAAMVAASGDPRRAEILYEDAYTEAMTAIEEGMDPIVIDRVLSYYFRVFEQEDLADAEKRLQNLRRGSLSAHDYGALADQSMRGEQEERDLESAIRYLRRAADLADGETDYRRALLHRLATILYITKDCDGAVRALETVVSLGGSNGSTLNNLAYMMLECRNDPDGALLYSTQAIQINPASPHFLDTHGFILFKVGRVEEAEVLLTRAVSIKPSVSNLLHLAMLMHETGRDDEAEILLEKLGKEFPRLAPEQQEEVNKLIAAIS